MREILFRGKRLDNGEWVDGYLYEHEPAFVGIASENDVTEPSKWFIARTGFADWNMPRQVVFVEVDTSTVGQYTGLKDKNGNRVFEGDILHISKISDGLGGYYQPPLDYPVNVAVKWDLCAWMWETLCEDKRYISFPDAWCQYECEVIGNIHDNPELLEGGDENK